MPFAALPSSPGFQLQPAPRWEGFGEKAIEMIANRKVVDTASMVEKAADQIDNILKTHSPKARMERAIEALKLKSQRDTFIDYNKHPEKYKISASGFPVLKDNDAQLSKQLDLSYKVLRNKALHEKVYGPKTTDPRNTLLSQPDDEDESVDVTVDSNKSPDETDETDTGISVENTPASMEELGKVNNG